MRLGLALALTLGLSSAAFAEKTAPTAAAGRDAAEIAKVEKIAEDVVSELAKVCPYADPSSQKAFDLCREGLFYDSKLRQNLVDYVLWGRQRDPNPKLADTNLTQFGRDVFTNTYVSLFMFNGKYKVSFQEKDNVYRVEAVSSFRNRLAPGQFPYPFWHEKEKWEMYEDANAMLFYIDPVKFNIRVVQFTPHAPKDPSITVERVGVRPFDGKWLWTDENGKTQPQATLFDGLFDAQNPHLKAMEVSYKQFAGAMREGTCFSCHVPNNPNKMKRLVLLQTPAHAASEIQRVIKTVTVDRMPVNDFGVEDPLKDELKGPLLERAKEFAAIVEKAKDWEKNNRDSLTGTVKKK